MILDTIMKFLSFISCVWCISARVLNDEIEFLPGWSGDLPSRHFSGYLDVANGTRHLHYYLVEFEGEQPETKPVVLWLNGGPGCSSLDGFIYEHGPFRIESKNPLRLKQFEYSWSKIANMIYLEAPVGVGFSYSDEDQDYQTNDDKTALDNLLALEKFFELFPHLAANNFFITGESYGGVYVPTLAEAIMKSDIAGKYTGAPLRGIAVGNGCTGNQVGTCSEKEKEKYLAKFLLNTALVSEPNKEKVAKECGDFKGQTPPSGKCAAALVDMHSDVGYVNLYDVYGECHNGSELALKAPVASSPSQLYSGLIQHSAVSARQLSELVQGPVACIDSRLATMYMTRPDVVKALHVIAPTKYVWAVCANQIKYTSNRENLPRDTYPELVEYLKTTIIYNGDFDACVPYTDNQDWTSNMNFEVVSSWHPWTYAASDEGHMQVGGYATRYKSPKNGNDFSFVTIKGGRHEVPETAPEQAFELLGRLVNNIQF